MLIYKAFRQGLLQNKILLQQTVALEAAKGNMLW